MFGAYILFPYDDEELYKTHRFYKSIETVNIGGLPFLPGSTKLVRSLLDDLISDSKESAFERTNLPSAKFGKKVKKVGRKAYYKCKKFKKLTVKSKKLTKKSRVAKNAFAGTNKKFKVKVKISNAKTKAATISVFKQKKIGYKPTWSVN